MLERFRTSAVKDEADSLFLGQVDEDNTPLLVPLDTAGWHVWAIGGTGSGKSGRQGVGQITNERLRRIVELCPTLIHATRLRLLAIAEGQSP